MKSFASDNYSGAHPRIIKSIERANIDHARGYGDDVYTQEAQQLFNELFQQEVGSFFVFNGTGANVLAIQIACQSYQSVVCAQTSHINIDECGAPEKITGTKLIPIPTIDGKLTPELIRPYLNEEGNQHHTQPRLISISQVTELGTCYTPDEIKAICYLAHAHGLLVHVDGARIANAAAYLQVPIAAFTNQAGVDILSFGGTKNGLLFGEALLVFNKELLPQTPYFRKQITQLHSKMRFIAAQYLEYLKDGLWLQLANHSNAQAKKLMEVLQRFPQIKLTQKMEGNGIFTQLPSAWIAPLQAQFPFYLWNETQFEARLMCAFDTTDEDIEQFSNILSSLTNEFN